MGSSVITGHINYQGQGTGYAARFPNMAVGQEFDAGLLRAGDGEHHAEVFVYEPPVIAQCRGDVPAGEHVRVRLVEANPTTRKVRFEYPA